MIAAEIPSMMKMIIQTMNDLNFLVLCSYYLFSQMISVGSEAGWISMNSPRNAG